MSDTLKDRTAKGMGWSLLDNLAGAGITFLVGLVLARLLSPSEYGILAIVMIFIAVSNSIVDSGFSSALVRKVKVSPLDYNTVFYFNLVVSAVLYVGLYFLSPFIADFFGQAILVPVTRVIGVVLVINGLAIIPRTIFVRSVNFKSQMLASLIASVASGVVGIGMALMDYGVWSLVGQLITRQLLLTVCLWWLSRWTPALEYSWESFRELFSFGSKLLVAGLIDTVYRHVVEFVIGKFYTTGELGQYTRADQFGNLVAGNMTSVIQRVSYPVLSSIQEEPERLLEGFRRVIKSSMLLSFAAMFGMAACARPMVLLLIGEKWLPSVYYLQILCLSASLYPLHAINLNILQVKGRSDLFLRLEVYKKLLGVGPILLGIFWGIVPMLWGGVVTSVLAFFLNSYYSDALLSYPSLMQVRDVAPTFCVSLVVAGCMWCVTLVPMAVYFQLAGQVLLGGGLALLLYEYFRPAEYLELKEIGLKLILRR
ncbi:MAG: flippase [Bacteroidetes bacterium]|nr:MAG: flippase [Bacteroidota bacterium]